MGRDNGIWLIAIYLFLSVYLLPMFPHGSSANELSRWATAASIVEKGSFDISWTEPLIGPNEDSAENDGKIYSNNPPGTAILITPVYAVVRLVVGPPDASNIRISWFAMRFFLSTLPLLLLAFWFFSRETDEMSLAVLLFATPLLLYSLLLYSHVFAAVVIYFAFRVVFDQRYILPWHSFAAGLLCGIAIISEFSAIVPSAVFGIGLILADKRERFKRPLYFSLGMLPFGLLLGLYNYELFGSVLSLSAAQSQIAVAGGFFGVGLPSLSNLYLLLFSPSRGLFFSTPIFLYSVFAFFASRNTRTMRHRVKVATIITTIVVISGYTTAYNGWAFGPQDLILIMPLLMDSFFDGEIFEMSNLWQGLWFGISFVFCTLPLLTFPFAPPEFAQPHRDFWLKFLIEEGWYTPNLANVIGSPSTIWAIIPVFLLLILAVYIVLRTARRPRRFLIGLAAAAVVTTAYLATPSRYQDPELSFERAKIAERFYMPTGRLDESKRQAADTGDIESTNRIREAESMISEARKYAPDDWPYLVQSKVPPNEMSSWAVNLHRQLKSAKAIKILRSGEAHSILRSVSSPHLVDITMRPAGDQ